MPVELSIVTTLYRSEPFVEAFYTRIVQESEKVTPHFEVILVNDGSPDGSLELAVALCERDPRVRVLDLSRNFGHHRAMMTGLAHALGTLVFLIDCDLEEDPTLLGQFHAEMQRTGADVVFGIREQRTGSAFERLSGRAFYAIFNVLSSVPIVPNVSTVRLMTRRYVASLVEHREREAMIAGLWAATGFAQVGVPIRKADREGSSYSLTRRVGILVNAITSFSDRPLVLIFYLGLLIFMLSGSAALYLVVRRVFFGVLLAGWPSLIVSVWLLGGLTLFAIGVVGIYLGKVFVETKARPYTIIRHAYGRDPARDPSRDRSSRGVPPQAGRHS